MNFIDNKDLLDFAQKALREAGEIHLTEHITIHWNPRLRTAAGRALLQTNTVEINPKISQYGVEEVWTTVRHELAHLMAWQRSRESGHGSAWKKACADLGIPGESTTHDLPLPRRTQRKNWRYKCPHCPYTFDRARRAKPKSACGHCCKKFNNGKFSNRYLLKEFRLVYKEK